MLLTTAGDGTLGISEPDQLFYLQYARNMATGEPYVFSAGDSPSSGSTTHLYVAILALIYRLGATGDLFLTATYILNAAFYLGCITCVWLIAKKMAEKSLWFVMTLTVLSGHLASAILKQTDIGLFTLLTLGLLASLIYRRPFTTCILTMTCAAARPEGMIFSIAFIMCGTAGMIAKKQFDGNHELTRDSTRYIIYGILGCLIFGITLGINYKTTGYWQFMSVANKGYFNRYPLSGAIMHTLGDLLAIFKGFFLGLQENQRQYNLFPVISGILGIGGILFYRHRKSTTTIVECWLALSVLGTLLLIASSQFQGLSNDRYLGWIMPIWIIYVAIGWQEFSKRIRIHSPASIVAILLICYQPLSLARSGAESYSNAVYLNQEKQFVTSIRENFPDSARFCVHGGSGINFYIPEYTIYNPYGITSPDFFEKSSSPIERIADLLKHRPELRFEYWAVPRTFPKSHPWLEPLVGEKVLEDTDSILTTGQGLGIYKTNWETLDKGFSPQFNRSAVRNLQLVDHLDVGYIPDEKKFDYHFTPRLKNVLFPLIATTDTLGDIIDYPETGRTIYGSESFSIPKINPNKAITLLLRTGHSARGTTVFGLNAIKNNKTHLNKQLVLNLYIDNKEVPCPPIQLRDEGFSEIVLTIPADYINSESVEIEIAGDHISYAYWIYQ